MPRWQALNSLACPAGPRYTPVRNAATQGEPLTRPARASTAPLVALAALLLAGLLSGRSILHADDASSHLTVPDAAAQRNAEKLIKDLFKAEYERKRPEDRRALAKKLLQQARDTSDDPGMRYVLFREAWSLAAEGADADTALVAVEEAAAIFALDEMDLEIRALDKA